MLVPVGQGDVLAGRHRVARVFVAGTLAAALLGWSGIVRADPKTEAQALFEAGREAAKRGDCPGAIDHFSRARALYPTAGSLYNIADCEERIGRLVSARAHWAELVGELAAGDERVADAKTHVEALDRRIPTVKVVLPPGAPAGTSVVLDGAPVASEKIGVEQPIDPGQHVVVVAAAGRVRGRTTVVVAEGARGFVVRGELGGVEAAAPVAAPVGKRSKKIAVDVCDVDSECQSGSCKNGRCTDAPEARTGMACETDKECGGPDHVCKAGICETNAKKNWFGLVVQQDLVYFSAAKDACLNGTIYTCYDGSGEYYAPNQNATLAGVGDEVKAGFGVATQRLLLTYDRLMNDNIQLGGRLGYAWGGGPDGISESSLRPNSPFVPVHIEARSSLWIGSEPFTRTGVRPYLVAAFGFAQFDARWACRSRKDSCPGRSSPGSDRGCGLRVVGSA